MELGPAPVTFASTAVGALRWARGEVGYRGASLIRSTHTPKITIGPYRRPLPRVLGES